MREDLDIYRSVPFKAFVVISFPVFLMSLMVFIVNTASISFWNIAIFLSSLVLILGIVNSAFYWGEVNKPVLKISDQNVYFFYAKEWIVIDESCINVEGFRKGCVEISFRKEVILMYLNESGVEALMEFKKKCVKKK